MRVSTNIDNVKYDITINFSVSLFTKGQVDLNTKINRLSNSNDEFLCKESFQ